MKNEPVNTNPQPRHEVKLPPIPKQPHAVPAKSRPQHMADAFASAPVHAFPAGFFEPGEPS